MLVLDQEEKKHVRVLSLVFTISFHVFCQQTEYRNALWFHFHSANSLAAKKRKNRGPVPILHEIDLDLQFPQTILTS